MAGNAQPVYDSTDAQFVGNAAVADLGTSGTSTVAQIEAKVNAILAALRNSNVISG